MTQTKTRYVGFDVHKHYVMVGAVDHNQQVVRFDRESRKKLKADSTERILDFIRQMQEGYEAIVRENGKVVPKTPREQRLKKNPEASKNGNRKERKNR